MNLLLLARDEVDARGRVTLADRRAKHLLKVLQVAVGRELRVGLIDGPLGSATVCGTGADVVSLQCAFDPTPPPQPRDLLLLAVPRPKVLGRCLEDAATWGIGTIVLMRTWCVDRSHLDSHHLDPTALRARLLAGMEQGRRTHVPDVVIEPLFKPFVQDRLPQLLTDRTAYVAHPFARQDIATATPGDTLALAIGPERGFRDFEVESLVGAGCTAVRAGDAPLRVEAGLNAIWGQLDLLRRRENSPHDLR